MAFRIRDNHEVSLDAITTLGNNKAASLLLLSFAKVSNTKDLRNTDLPGDTLYPHLVTSQ